MDNSLAHLSSKATTDLEQPDAEERYRIHEIESQNAMLAVYFKGCLNGISLFNELKEAEVQGKQYLVKNARCRLEGSFMERKLPFKFCENGDGIVSVELLDIQAGLHKTPA